VQQHLRNMLERGWLLEVRKGGGRGRANEYRINPAWLKGAELAPFPAPAESDGKGAEIAPFGESERVQNDALKGAKLDTAYKNHKNRRSTPLTPQGGHAGFEALLAEYPKHRRNLRAARREWAKLMPSTELAARITAAARQQAASAEWQAEAGKRVPNLSKWLANEGWRATHEDAQAGSVPAAAAPVERVLSAEQRAANKARAAQLADASRRAIAERRLRGGDGQGAPAC